MSTTNTTQTQTAANPLRATLMTLASESLANNGADSHVNAAQEFAKLATKAPYGELLTELTRAETRSMVALEDGDEQTAATLNEARLYALSALEARDMDLKAAIARDGIKTLTGKGQPFAGKGKLAPEGKFLTVPYDAALFGRIPNWGVKLETVKGEHRLTLVGKGGKTSYTGTKRIETGLADLATVPARLDALRAELGFSDLDAYGDFVAECVTGTCAQQLLGIVNRADALRADGKPVTREALKPKKETAKSK